MSIEQLEDGTRRCSVCGDLTRPPKPSTLDEEIEALIYEHFHKMTELGLLEAGWSWKVKTDWQGRIRALVERHELVVRQQPRENIAGGDACPHCGRSWTQQPAKQWPSGEQGR